MKKTYEWDPWFVEFTPEDGARLNRLCFHKYDLLTTEPDQFAPPSTDYGMYETRPVYGYDDCFPSVEVSKYPEKEWIVPDHGELCWLKWDVEKQKNELVFSVNSKILPLHFQRIMRFADSKLEWTFKVTNSGENVLPFQHIIHPLMKLNDIIEINLPSFTSVNNEKGENIQLKNPKSVESFLLTRDIGETNMLFLQNIKEGRMSWAYENGLQLEMTFPVAQFPTIGIWWNNNGYPDEDGCRRKECAFEPVPGPSSSLSHAYEEDQALYVNPDETFSWQIIWDLDLSEFLD